MTREIRITSENFLAPSDQDCILSPDDPINQIRGAALLGTATPAMVDAAYSNKKLADEADPHFALRQQALDQGIRPGTPAWFAMTQKKS